MKSERLLLGAWVAYVLLLFGFVAGIGSSALVALNAFR